MNAATSTSSAAAATMMSAPTPTSTPSSALGPLRIDPSQGECELLGPFALIVQAALGALALLSLVYKRWRERPQRPLKVWFFDASKQVFGSVLVHMSNIFLSMLTSGRFTINAAVRQKRDEYIPNPCSFYLLNLAIDTTIGIPILIILIRVFTAMVSLTPLGKPYESIQSGYYGHPPNSWWWLKQSFIYFSGLFVMKICVLIIFVMMPWISQVGDWALGWTEGDEKLQVAFVMMIFPLIMNAIQYYIIDSFIKKPVSDHQPLLSGEDPDEGIRIFDGARFSALGVDDDDTDDESDDHDDQDHDPEDSSKPREQSFLSLGRQEYDPDADSHSSTIVGSSSGSHHIPQREDISTALLPKE